MLTAPIERPWQWQEDGYTVTSSTCWSGPGTHGGCGVLVYSKDDKLVKIEGDPECPFNQGRACAKTLSMRRFINHPQRLKYPLKRVGERGEDKWERISWDEAIDTIVDEFNRLKKDYGPESVFFVQGTGRDVMLGLARLAYSYGSPNSGGFAPANGQACYLPRILCSNICTGEVLNVADMSQLFPDRYDNPQWKRPGCIMVWGNNPTTNTCADIFFGHWITDCMKKGSELIVIDPRATWIASKAKHWLQIRPGTDSALALGFMNVIINEKLYDEEFVQNWTHGFDQLKTRVQEYPPERVAEITWIPKDKIMEAARMYATTKPACIQWGVAFDHNIECVDPIRAALNLMAVTGNVDVPGGNVLVKNIVEWMGWGEEEFGTEDLKKKKLWDTKNPLWGDLPIFQPDKWLESMFSGDPYSCKGGWIQGTNTIVGSFAGPRKAYEAFKKLEFVVVTDLFMTPTAAAFADIVLPAAMFPERDSIKTWGWDRMQAINKAVEPAGECKGDLDINLEIGKRLNPEAWPWNSVEEIYDDFLEPLGMTFKELREKGPVYPKFEYRKYEKGLLRPDGKPGFKTPTGKFELASTIFEQCGHDPLPNYEEPPESPVSTPELMKEYPLVLTTGARTQVRFHSEHRQYGTGLRELEPDPRVEIHPETAKGLGIRDGDWVWIESRHGKCRQKARLTPIIDPRVVNAQHSWWFPEKSMEEPSLGGVWESNINLLFPSDLRSKTGFGYPFKSWICKVYKEEK
ncbi:MAG: molybdopterin-dependent oxidoreductase [Deltaproteobacteria bacterium]|nr:molybdopterin-dependent oxidoreductase [Deltaproteobacteria bacterium]